jgi:hypothetical protein
MVHIHPLLYLSVHLVVVFEAFILFLPIKQSRIICTSSASELRRLKTRLRRLYNININVIIV